jgi:hypothetical protein
MFWNRSSADILTHWQSEIETSLEAGATPLLHAGYSNLALESAVGLDALYTLEHTREDVAAPVLIVGGNDPVWLAALLAAGAGAEPPRPPDPVVIYGGADRATHWANLFLVSAAHEPPPLQSGTMPFALQWWFAPGRQPGAPALWEALPFVVASRSDSSAGDDWTAWVTIFTALSLVLIAVFV